MKDALFICNALIPGRKAIPLLRIFTAPIGNWIRGTVTLQQDQLIFSTNRLNALHQEDASDMVIRYDDIAACALGRLAVFLKTVDLDTSLGLVRFRCLFSSNEALLAEVMQRRRPAQHFP